MQRSLASSLAEDIIARMRASAPNNLAAYVASDYGNNQYAAPNNRCEVSCTPAQMVTNDQFEWEFALMGADVTTSGNNAGGLIGALGCIFVIGSNVTVVVNWQGRKEMTDANKASNCGVTSENRRQLVMQAFII
jgi:type IV pilus assembly protein PilV